MNAAPSPTPLPAPTGPREAVVTVVFGTHPERLDHTFLSFSQNPHLDLHAFVLGDALPERRFPGVHYHLRPFDPAFGHPMRDADFRRWLFLDDLDYEHVLVVDGLDVLCLRPLPRIRDLLRGASVAGCVEHLGGRYFDDHVYTSNFLNAGVTYWHVPSTRDLRRDVVERGRARFRNLIDDQLALNEVLHARYAEHLIVLPCHFNYRAHLAPLALRGWPTVPHLDGVFVYHNWRCIDAVKRILPVKPHAELAPLALDDAPVARPWQQNLRRLRQRLRPHVVK